MPSVSEKQHRAMEAAAHGHSTIGIPEKVGKEFVSHDENLKQAAGLMLVAPSGKMLFVKRSSKEKNYAGHWGLPGGNAEEGEEPDAAAIREASEEIGRAPSGPLKLVDRVTTPTGIVFSTYSCEVPDEFDPVLNDEHVDHCWALPKEAPQPLHPGVAATISKNVKAQDAMANDHFALDKASVRRTDEDGHLHVEMTPISKANVCEYYGREIPNYEGLGLDPDKMYKLLRDPVELEKAAETFSGKPLLLDHTPVSADDHPKKTTVGSVGNEVTWKAPYLMAPLSIWDGDAIRKINDGSQKELSSAYRYDADMTPGSHEGEAYDGVMRNIRGNHVALVHEGRAGKDVVVGDSALDRKRSINEVFMMPKSLNDKFALDAFEEGKHPRAENGQFGAGGSSGGNNAERKRDPASMATTKTPISNRAREEMDKFMREADRKGYSDNVVIPSLNDIIEHFREKGVQPSKPDPDALSIPESDSDLDDAISDLYDEIIGIGEELDSGDDTFAREYEIKKDHIKKLRAEKKRRAKKSKGGKAQDSFEEGKHPRAQNGQFGSGTKGPVVGGGPNGQFKKIEPSASEAASSFFHSGAKNESSPKNPSHLRASSLLKMDDKSLTSTISKMTSEQLHDALKDHDSTLALRKKISSEVDSRDDGRPAGRPVNPIKKGQTEYKAHDSRPTTKLQPKESQMAKNLMTRKAALIQGALMVNLAPKLAQDAKLNLGPILRGVTNKNFEAKLPGIVAGIEKATVGKLAQDADISDLASLLDTFSEVHPAEDDEMDPNSGILEAAKEPPEGEDKLRACLPGAMDMDDTEWEELKAKLLALIGGEADTDPAADEDVDVDPMKKDEDKGMVDQKAMDSAISAAVLNERKNAREVEAAKDAVRPYVGKLALACDTAADVYKAALTSMKVDIAGVHPSAFGAILRSQPLPGKGPASANVAMDSKEASGFAERFPNVARIRQA